MAIVESTEWTFAADAAKWMSLFLHGQTKSPFTDAKVEQRSSGSAKRSDLILYDRDGKPALTGEIKLPDTTEGQTPFHAKLVSDARRKAARLGRAAPPRRHHLRSRGRGKTSETVIQKFLMNYPCRDE